MNKPLIKVYYYQDGKQEKVIGNQQSYEAKLAKNSKVFAGKTVLTKMTKPRTRTIDTQLI